MLHWVKVLRGQVADSHNPGADSLAATLEAVSCPEVEAGNRIPAADNLAANRQAQAQSHWHLAERDSGSE